MQRLVSRVLQAFACLALLITMTATSRAADVNGTWTWTFPTADGPEDNQTVTVTAGDGTNTAAVTFGLTVNNVAPTVALNGLPPGDFPLSIFDTVLNGITVRGSIVGTRLDLQEALDFASEGKVRATVTTDTLENINDIFARMHHGEIEGRIVIDFEGGAH